MSTNSWNDAVEHFRNQLSAADRESLRLIETQVQRQGAADILGRRTSVFGDDRNVNNLSHLIDLIRPIATVADAIAPVACVPSSSIWGAFSLVIEMTQSKREFIEAILHIYKSLFAAAPRMEGYLKDENLMQSKLLQHTIQEVFGEFLNITLRCIKVFGRNESSTLNIIQKIRWMRYLKTLNRSLDVIEKLTEDVDREANKAMQARVVQVMERRSESNDDTRRPLGRKYMIPYVKNPVFTGRTNYLRQIHNLIGPEAVEDSGEQQSLVLYGLAGIGKTQVALQYAHTYQAEHDACFWITCDNRVKISKDITEMARRLGLSNDDRDHNIALVNEWLSTTDQSWLLVLDNVESLNDVQGIWPSCNKGSILVTTQDSGTRLREDIKHSIQILSMEHGDGVHMVRSIFQKHGKSVSDRAAERILRETDSSPFSIRQLCSYICVNELDPDRFLDRYSQGYDNVDVWDEGMPPSYQRTLSNFLDLTFQKLSEDDIALVAQFAFLDPDTIQSKLLCFPSNEDELHVSMRNLHRYSLVSIIAESAPVTYNIHRVVKRYLLSHMSDAQLGEAIDSLTKRLRAEFPRQTPWEDEVNNKKWVHSELIPHIVAINKSFEKASELTSVPDILAQNLLDGAFDLWLKGLLEEGRELIKSAMTLSSRHNFDDLLTAEIISFKGTLEADSGNVNEAYSCFREALEIQRKRPHDRTFIDEIYLANSYNNFAGICDAKGDYVRANINNEVAIFIKEKWRDAQRREGRSLSHLLCLSYQNQANTLAHQGQFDKAAAMFDKALQEGRDEVSAARQGLTYHNYGCMRLEQGRVEEACSLLKSACLKREESLDSHPDTALSQHMLAICYQRRTEGVRIENLTLARELLSDAVGILEARAGNLNKRRLARTLYKLSCILGEMGDAEETNIRAKAEKLYSDVKPGDVPNGERSYDELVPYI